MVLSALVWNRSFRKLSRSFMLSTGVLLTFMPVSSIVNTICLTSGFGLTSFGVCGSAMSRPRCATGVSTMKMIKSTIITSMSGVMLMSAIELAAEGFAFRCECSTWRFLPDIVLAPHLRLGDEGHFFDAPVATGVHDLHHLRV